MQAAGTGKVRRNYYSDLKANTLGLACLETMMRMLGCLLLFWSTGPGSVRAVFPEPRETKTVATRPALDLTALIYTEPRSLRCWVARIDLTDPNLDIRVTPPRAEDSFETSCQTTLEFAREQAVHLAVNASPFRPFRQHSGQGMDIVGLGVHQGERYSEPQGNYGALVLDPADRPRIVVGPIKIKSLKNAWTAVTGFTVVLKDGRNRYAAEADFPKSPAHPRTAVGVTTDGKTLVFLVVDGRQKGVSEGVTLKELAELGKAQGCADLLNLDGGGSTTLVYRETLTAQPRVLNTPVGRGKPNTLRLNGNHIGIRFLHPPEGVSVVQLRAIMPRLTAERAARFVGPINQAMREAEINTPKRRAAFLAQIALESAQLRHMEELADGKAYEGRKALGNIEPGDGPRFKGRGPIQLTGRTNYTDAGKALGLDLVGQPERVAIPEVGCRVAAWYWQSRGLNALADQGDFVGITRRINGGTNGLKQRQQYHQWAKATLGVAD